MHTASSLLALLVCSLLFCMFASEGTLARTVGILHAEDGNNLTQMEKSLKEEFDNVTVFNGINGTPTSEWFEGLDAVLIFSDESWGNQSYLGDLVADFVDNGGGVVTAVYHVITCCEGSIIAGRFYEDYLLVVPYVGDKNGDGATATKIKDHAILDSVNITALEIGQNAIDRPWPNATLTEGTYRVLDWSDGAPLVVVKDDLGLKSNSRRVDLGWWPVPAEDWGSFHWDPSNGATGTELAFKQLVINSLKYVLRNETTSGGGTSSSASRAISPFAFWISLFGQ